MDQGLPAKGARSCCDQNARCPTQYDVGQNVSCLSTQAIRILTIRRAIPTKLFVHALRWFAETIPLPPSPNGKGWNRCSLTPWWVRAERPSAVRRQAVPYSTHGPKAPKQYRERYVGVWLQGKSYEVVEGCKVRRLARSVRSILNAAIRV